VKPAAWLEREILVTVGTGGVGKTTLAAAFGLEAARAGRRALVITIDPARRLADALGLDQLDHEERELPAELRARAGFAPGGRLFAMMLDTRRAFDELAARLVPDPQMLARIQRNVIYRNLTDALSGSREYSALEKLHELHASRRYDLIVVDTPPAGHALEFLDAPRRLAGMCGCRPMHRSGSSPFQIRASIDLEACDPDRLVREPRCGSITAHPDRGLRAHATQLSPGSLECCARGTDRAANWSNPCVRRVPPALRRFG